MNRIGALAVGSFVLVLALVWSPVSVSARTRKGDRFLAEGKLSEAKGDLDKALQLYEAAVGEDPTDAAYLLNTRRARFNAAATHVKEGQKIRAEGRLTEALTEFQRAYATDPASPIAQQEIRRTKAMIDRETRKANGQPEVQATETRGLTPSELARKDQAERVDSLQGVPELRPLNNSPINLRISGQRPHVFFETLGKVAGINVLFDPDFDQQAQKPLSVDLTGSSLIQALDYIALLAKAYWKPLSANAIFVTVDNPQKRRDFEEQVVRVFYLQNVTVTTELQELITTLRTVTDIQKVYQYTAQNAVIVRCSSDKMLLVEKIISDLDKPRSEVIVDVVVMEVSSDRMRTLGTQLLAGGLNSTIAFNPTRASILGNTAATTTTTGTTTGNATGTTGTGVTTTGTSTTTNGTIPLNNIGKISTGDFSISGIPGGLLEAMMSDTGTRVIQTPQLRAVDNNKVTLHIGDKVPTASGSFGSGVGSVGVGVSPLVQTQFTYIETGVNMEMNPRVHDNNQVSLHIEIDISQVTGYRDVGSISQPVISQRKVVQDIRTEDGQINLLGGLMQEQTSNTKTGTPGLASIPLLGRLFSATTSDKARTELVISLIPHIIRSPEISAANARGVATGADQIFRVTRSTPATAPAIADAPTAQPAAAPPATAPALALASSAAISFLPAQLETGLNTAVSVTLRAANVTDLGSIVAQLKFDPKILHINGVTAGDLMQQTGPPLTPSINIFNDTGNATVTLARALSGPGVSGSGGLITISFQAVGTGSTTVSLQQLALKTSPGQAIGANTPSLTITVK